MNYNAIQFVETARNEFHAAQMLEGMALQDGYLGGRLLPPSPSKPVWQVQAFLEWDGQTEGWLPDGMRRVFIPSGQHRAMGIIETLEA